MPTCDRCDGFVPRTAKNCPTCNSVVNPSGTNPLVSEQPRPKRRGTAYSNPLRHGGERVPITDFYPELDGARQEPKSIRPTSRHASESNRAAGTRTEPSTSYGGDRSSGLGERPSSSETDRVSRTSHSIELISADYVTRRVMLHFLNEREAVFRIANENANGYRQSDSFRLRKRLANVGAKHATRVLDAFIRDLRERGWKKIGQGALWFEVEVGKPKERHSRSTAKKSFGSAQKKESGKRSRQKTQEVSALKATGESEPASTQPNAERKSRDRYELVRVIELQIRSDHSAVFSMQDAIRSKYLTSEPFPASKSLRETLTAQARVALSRFEAQLRKRGWKQVSTGGNWYQFKMCKALFVRAGETGA